MAAQHTMDLVAADLAQWLDDTSSWLSDAMKDGGRAPFAANASNAERMQYYDAAMFNPDGSPNQQGRAAELDRLGVVGYGKTLAAVMQARQQRVGGMGSSGQAVQDEPMGGDATGAAPMVGGQ